MGKGAPSGPQETTSTVTQSNLPEYAEPYFKNVVNRAQAESYRPYTPYEGQRIAEFDPMQTQAQQEIGGLQTPGQFGAASNLSYASGLGSLMAGQYAPGQFSYDQVSGQQYNSPQMNSAQTGFNAGLQNYQMAGDQEFGQSEFDQYASPYMQNVVDVQKREAVTDAQKAQLIGDLGASRQGTYGGARQLLAGTERERALGQQLGDIEARGLQSTYENAQQQFERDRASRFGIGSQNLNASLQTQGLGAQTGLQAALANLDADQQGRVQNMSAQLQTQGLNADQALRAALANQQTGLDAQRLLEQSRQFGGSLGLQGLSQANTAAGTLGQLGANQQTSDINRLQTQNAAGAEQQAQQQQYLDTAYADFLRQRDYPMEQLGYYSNLLRGLPVALNSTATTYAPPPSMAAHVGGAGLGALSLAKLAG